MCVRAIKQVSCQKMRSIKLKKQVWEKKSAHDVEVKFLLFVQFVRLLTSEMSFFLSHMTHILNTNICAWTYYLYLSPICVMKFFSLWHDSIGFIWQVKSYRLNLTSFSIDVVTIPHRIIFIEFMNFECNLYSKFSI